MDSISVDSLILYFYMDSVTPLRSCEKFLFLLAHRFEVQQNIYGSYENQSKISNGAVAPPPENLIRAPEDVADLNSKASQRFSPASNIGHCTSEFHRPRTV